MGLPFTPYFGVGRGIVIGESRGENAKPVTLLNKKDRKSIIGAI